MVIPSLTDCQLYLVETCHPLDLPAWCLTVCQLYLSSANQPPPGRDDDPCPCKIHLYPLLPI